MAFRKGVSGNPGGRRPGVCAYLQKQYGKNGEKLFKELHGLALTSEDEHVRVKALSLLLDRGWGKPTEPHEHTFPDPVRVVHTFKTVTS